MTVRKASGIAATLALLGGCADLMGRSVVAPEWFEAKAEEVKGQGYPSLRAVPQPGEFTSVDEWQVVVDDLESEAAPLRAAAADEMAAPTSAEIRARAAQMRAGVTDETEASGETH